MAAYLICRNGVDDLETIVFSAGPNENEEAVAVFSDPAKAEAYLQAAGLDGEYTVATVDPIPFLRWVITAHDNGVQHLVVDPDYEQQKAGQKLTSLSIEAQLEHAGDRLIQGAEADS
ncbi:MAG: hypothetical protein D6753_09865 [Planctomycetota bacterium]|nr:MAG: hypothetical protein D6753_09865 [Planctomycetota bacterium]